MDKVCPWCAKYIEVTEEKRFAVHPNRWRRPCGGANKLAVVGEIAEKMSPRELHKRLQQADVSKN